MTPFEMMEDANRKNMCIDDVTIIEGMVWNADVVDKFNEYVKKENPGYADDESAYAEWLGEHVVDFVDSLGLEEYN